MILKNPPAHIYFDTNRIHINTHAWNISTHKSMVLSQTNTHTFTHRKLKISTHIFQQAATNCFHDTCRITFTKYYNGNDKNSSDSYKKNITHTYTDTHTNSLKKYTKLNNLNTTFTRANTHCLRYRAANVSFRLFSPTSNSSQTHLTFFNSSIDCMPYVVRVTALIYLLSMFHD